MKQGLPVCDSKAKGQVPRGGIQKGRITVSLTSEPDDDYKGEEGERGITPAPTTPALAGCTILAGDHLDCG